MKDNTATVLALGAFFFLVCSQSASRKKRKSLENPSTPANDLSTAGIRVENGKLRVVDWSEWMKTGPRLIHLSLREGTESAEDVTANVMRRLFPEYRWPPVEGDPFFSTWNDMVAVVGRSLDAPTRPHLEVVS